MPRVNDAPIAQAGMDQHAFVDDVVILDAYSSYDLDHDPLTYGKRQRNPIYRLTIMCA